MKPNITWVASLFVLSLAGLVLPTITTQAQSSKPLVEAVEVVGNRRLSSKDVLSHIKTRPGEPFSVADCERDLDELLALGVFDKLQTRVIREDGLRGGVVVIFEVVELPLLLEVKFNKLRGIDESEVRRVFRKKGFKLEKGAVYDPVKVLAAKRVLEELLASRGWPNTVIAIRNEIGGGYVSVEFEIEYEDERSVELQSAPTNSVRRR